MKVEELAVDKDILRSIRWVAAEYKFVTKLKDELEQIHKESRTKKEIKELQKAVSILCYLSRAERRASRFEEKVDVDLHRIYSGLSEHLGHDFSLIENIIQEFRSVIEE